VNLNLSWVYRYQMSGVVFEIPLPRECIILIGLLIEVCFSQLWTPAGAGFPSPALVGIDFGLLQHG
jgi:hypothetical protein